MALLMASASPCVSCSAVNSGLTRRYDGVAGVGQAQVTRGALDQPQAEIGFQPLHRSTEARFGMPEHARGGAETAMLDDLAKQLPIPPIHPAIVHAAVQCVQEFRFPGETSIT